jgi:hypothetical protein
MSYPSFVTGEVLTAADMNAVGLWKVGSGTLSLTTTPINVTGVFSSTYKQYRLLINVTTKSTTLRVDMKYINGTTATSTNYYQAGIGANYLSDSVLYYTRTNNGTQFSNINSPANMTVAVDIFNANKAATTIHKGILLDANNSFPYMIGGVQDSTTQFTGFQLFTSTGTAAAEYQVFGYRD